MLLRALADSTCRIRSCRQHPRQAGARFAPVGAARVPPAAALGVVSPVPTPPSRLAPPAHNRCRARPRAASPRLLVAQAVAQAVDVDAQAARLQPFVLRQRAQQLIGGPDGAGQACGDASHEVPPTAIKTGSPTLWARACVLLIQRKRWGRSGANSVVPTKSPALQPLICASLTSHIWSSAINGSRRPPTR